MKLIVGLGNPGKEYEKTRHNVGFMVIDEIVRRLSMEVCDMSRWEAHTAEASVNGEKVVFLKPQTFMNLSGRSVAKFAHYYKIEPKDIWVISDELDLPLTRIRTRHEGSSGGHNGLKSLIECLGTDQFSRIRVGVGHYTGNQTETEVAIPEPEASIFVLQPFDKREEPILDKVVMTTADLVLDSLEQNLLKAETVEVPHTQTAT